jgi:hypothetical protein
MRMDFSTKILTVELFYLVKVAIFVYVLANLFVIAACVGAYRTHIEGHYKLFVPAGINGGN